MEKINELLNQAWELGITVNELTVPSPLYEELKNVSIYRDQETGAPVYESDYMVIRILKKDE